MVTVVKVLAPVAQVAVMVGEKEGMAKDVHSKNKVIKEKDIRIEELERSSLKRKAREDTWDFGAEARDERIKELEAQVVGWTRESKRAMRQ